MDNTTTLAEFRLLPEFQAAIELNNREHIELEQMSIYSDLHKVEKLKTFQKVEASTNGEAVYCFYGMFLPRFKKFEDMVFLTLIKRLENDLPTIKNKYSILFFNSLCQGYTAFMGFKNMLKRFPEKYFSKLSRIIVVHPEKYLTPVQWLSFGIVNKYLNKLTHMVDSLEELAQYGLDVTRLMLTLPKEISSFKSKNQLDQQLLPGSMQDKTIKAPKDTVLRKIQTYELSAIGVPEYLKTLVSYFETKPEKLKTEGIFRKSGSIDDVKLIARLLSKKNSQYMYLMDDPHPICVLIKSLFASLEQPIFSNENYTLVLNSNVEQYHPVAKHVLHSLPILHYNALSYLLGFILYRVIPEEKFNKMGVYNVAVVLTPCLFRPKHYSGQDIMSTSKFVSFLMKLLTSYAKYFSSRNCGDVVYRQQAQMCIGEVTGMMPKPRKGSTSNNLQSMIPSKPTRMEFPNENQC